MKKEFVYFSKILAKKQKLNRCHEYNASDSLTIVMAVVELVVLLLTTLIEHSWGIRLVVTSSLGGLKDSNPFQVRRDVCEMLDLITLNCQFTINIRSVLIGLCLAFTLSRHPSLHSGHRSWWKNHVPKTIHPMFDKLCCRCFLVMLQSERMELIPVDVARL